MAKRKKKTTDRGTTNSINYNRVLKQADYQAFGVTRRKGWEIAMALKTLRELGATGPDALILGAGAGRERTIFELANATDAKRVYATDIYNAPGIWGDWHGPEFVQWPAKFSPVGVHFDTSRILAEHADMCHLPYEDNFFDGIFSSGAIEHVGDIGLPDYPAIQQAARELGRVVKPGGIISLSTEWKLSGDGWGWSHVRLFDEAGLRAHIIEPSGCELVDTPDWTFDGNLDDAVSLQRMVQGHVPDVEVCIQEYGYVFTSVHVALRKP